MSDEPIVKIGHVVGEYVPEVTINGVAADATELFTLLTGDKAFCEVDLCPPPLDLSGSDWLTPEADFKLSDVKPLTIDQFTNEEGDGVFDVMADAVKDLLRNEHEQGRITSTDYSRSFTTLLEATLANATQFSLQKDISYWAAKKGVYEAYSARAQAELLKQQIALARLQIANQQMEYAQGKMSLMGAKVQYDTAVGQRDITLPKQAESQDAQIALYGQQIESYKRNAEAQYIDQLHRTYTAIYGISEGENIPILDGAKPANLNVALAELAVNLGMKPPSKVGSNDEKIPGTEYGA